MPNKISQYTLENDMKFSRKAPIVSNKQDGFTLLELLVVITLLAIISLGALAAYEGLGEIAEETAASNNIAASDRAIRTFAAREGVYPNQWDNLVNLDDGTVNDFIAEETQEFIGTLDLAAVAAPERLAIVTAMQNAGITEFQSLVSTSTFAPGSIPNESWNESNPAAIVDPADELEVEIDDATGLPVIEFDGAAAAAANISIVASGGAAGACTVDGAASLASTVSTTDTDPITSAVLNRINDLLDDDGCHLVLAVGFGKDVPGTTLETSVAIAGAPTFTSADVNPSENYARYLALFYIGTSDEDGATPTQVTEFRNQAKLLAVVDTEGNNIDQTIAGAFQEDDSN